MPWHVAKGGGTCPVGEWAVIKDSDGSTAGCHPTRAAADKQMAALYANEPGRDHMAAVERRFTLVTVELRASDDSPRIGGYGAVFNKPSDNLGGFTEVVMPGFFNDWRAKNWPGVMARYNHDDNQLLGTVAGGTLRLQVDDTGLYYEVAPPAARGDVVELVGRGDVRGSSFAFRVPPGGDDWAMSDLGFPQRSLLGGGQLVDVGPVNSPAYPDATAGLRSLAAKFDADPEEVRSLAASNELRRFFVKTDAGMGHAKPKPRTLGAVAAVQLLARKQDPWG
jgi:HK97 family phage prohead protease